MQFNGFYMKPPSKENENEVIEENTHFPVIAIVGACVSILFLLLASYVVLFL